MPLNSMQISGCILFVCVYASAFQNSRISFSLDIFAASSKFCIPKKKKNVFYLQSQMFNSSVRSASVPAEKKSYHCSLCTEKFVCWILMNSHLIWIKYDTKFARYFSLIFFTSFSQRTERFGERVFHFVRKNQVMTETWFAQYSANSLLAVYFPFENNDFHSVQCTTLRWLHRVLAAEVELEMKLNGCVTWLSAAAIVAGAASAALNLKPTENWSPLFVHAIRVLCM